MIKRGYEIVEEVIKNDGTLTVSFFQEPVGKKQKEEKEFAMSIMHMVGGLIDENTPLCVMHDLSNGYYEMEFTKEAIDELYQVLKKEGVIKNGRK